MPWQTRCKELSKQCSALLIAFRDKIDRDSLNDAEFAKLEDTVSR